MDHQFVAAEGQAIQGVWFEDNGSIVCRWWWDPERDELEVRRGSITRKQRLGLEAELRADSEALKDHLKSQALEFAQQMA